MNRQLLKRTFYFVMFIGLASAAFAKPAHAGPTTRQTHHHVARVQESAHARRHMAELRHARPVGAERRVVMVRTRSGMVRRTVLVRHRSYEHFSASSAATESAFPSACGSCVISCGRTNCQP